MNISDFGIVTDLIASNENRPVEDAVTRTSSVSAEFTLQWQSEYATHIDSQFVDNLNLWRDHFPPEIEIQLEGRHIGDVTTHSFSTGEILEEFSTANVCTVKQKQFNRDISRQIRLEPRLGRFYPREIFDNIPENYSSNYLPCRIIGIEDDALITDFNHPLAAKTLDIKTRIISIWNAGQEHGGQCNDIIDILASNGPGMQARYEHTATDFWSDDPFSRQDPSPDDEFYAQPRLVDHLDKNCSQHIGGLYRQLLPHDGRILDLMSSWVSHLPQAFSAAEITGLGMNPDELEQNPLLAHKVVHDLNRNPLLPFDDESFDGVICTASIEYLVSPMTVFSELGRVLKPDAPLIITFSNRWFPPKAIKVWGYAHEFERIGLVLEYFINSGIFEKLHSYSLRGLPRPDDDKYAGQLRLSDPVYAAWGHKTLAPGTRST
ncbi:MAG: methyltransferase domain-containing protein [Gammaproteobacteria bacterium]|jgi:SAM-dependent methyltransferase